MEEHLKINGADVTVRKLPLKKYAELLGAFEELPKHLDLINGRSNDEIVANIPKLISTCYPDIVRVIKIATDMEEQDIDAMGLDDFIAVVEATLKVNNYTKIYERIKKITARPEVPEETAKEVASGSGGQ